MTRYRLAWLAVTRSWHQLPDFRPSPAQFLKHHGEQQNCVRLPIVEDNDAAIPNCMEEALEALRGGRISPVLGAEIVSGDRQPFPVQSFDQRSGWNGRRVRRARQPY